MKKFKLGAGEVLQKNELKSVFGGDQIDPVAWCGCSDGDNQEVYWPYVCNYYNCTRLCEAFDAGNYTGVCLY